MMTIYVPTNAEQKEDLEIGWNFVSPFQNTHQNTHQDVGLMLVIQSGQNGLLGDAKRRIHKNIEALTTKNGAISIIVMVSNLPIEHLDFYHKPKESIQHIQTAIDFAAELPGRANAIVTFHLNTLLTPEEWRAAGTDAQTRSVFFQDYFTRNIAPALAEVARYGKAKGVSLKIETTPIPEFGDRSDTPFLSSLGNPYPLYSGRGFAELRALGLGIVLDLCHTYTLYKAISLQRVPDEKFYETYKGIFPEDRTRILEQNFLHEVSALQDGDVVHLNDSLGIYDPERGMVHGEGIALGDGDIENLPELIRSIVKTKNVHVVFEINETDYETRPNLQKSIEYFKRATQHKKGE